MTLVVVLIAILAQRYLNIKSYLYRFHWIEPYTQWITSKTKQIMGGHGLVGLIMIVLPLLLVISLIFALSFHLFGIVGYALLNILLLWYCLDARDFRKDPYEDNQSSALLIFSYRHLFGVLFWYIFLGPIGLALYFIINELRLYLENHPQESQSSLLEFTVKTQGVLDWIPIRLLGLTYALVGNFSNTFESLQVDFFSGIRTNPQQLVAWGLAAQTEGTGNYVDIPAQETIAFIDRALIVWLIVLAIANVFFWIG